MRKKTILFVLTLSLLAFCTCNVHAGCTKTARGLLYAKVSYKTSSETSGTQSSGSQLVDRLETEGTYNGGCKTSVGRQKARKRARRNAINEMLERYRNNPQAQQNIVCSTGNARFQEFSSSASWIRIEQIKVTANSPGLVDFSSQRIQSTPRLFYCVNGRAVLYFRAGGPPTVNGRGARR